MEAINAVLTAFLFAHDIISLSADRPLYACFNLSCNRSCNTTTGRAALPGCYSGGVYQQINNKYYYNLCPCNAYIFVLTAFFFCIGALYQYYILSVLWVSFAPCALFRFLFLLSVLSVLALLTFQWFTIIAKGFTIRYRVNGIQIVYCIRFCFNL